MISKRIKRVNQLIKCEISQILLREIDYPKDILVTVTRAETSPDLRESRVFISIMPEENGKKIIQFLNRRIYCLQQKINKKLKMKPVPKITFCEEKKTKEAARIEKILDELKKQKK
jgi:ribosome-binding factor A